MDVRAIANADRSGSVARPVALPDDLDDPSIIKATGIVQLPDHVRWSGPPKKYDLADRRDRLRVYEQVLREGTEDDVRRYIDPDELILLWDELVLPGNVRSVWSRWLRERRRLEESC